MESLSDSIPTVVDINKINDSIFKSIKYKFDNEALLKEALSHSSKKLTQSDFKSNERLEFLGDSVLNMVVSDMLFRQFPDEQEGELSKRKSNLVNGSTISKIAQELKLCDFMIMENQNGGSCSQSTLENGLEALIGALYIDGGLEKAKQFITHHWKRAAKANTSSNFKTELQMWAQRNERPLPKYKTLKVLGPLHFPEFSVSVCIANVGRGYGKASTVKLAEQKAAKTLLNKIKRADKEGDKSTIISDK